MNTFEEPKTFLFKKINIRNKPFYIFFIEPINLREK